VADGDREEGLAAAPGLGWRWFLERLDVTFFQNGAPTAGDRLRSAR